ncbi:acyl-CoA thioesterase [Amphritea sp. HPY]|uniref:acyl-CoA thioesterase n=1 Tax=Amphritea sp. HPY TaxID=3421652 RepID=UPI003D7DEC5F
MNTPSNMLNMTSEQGNEVFITRHLIRFGDVDPAGIAYFPRIHNYIHESFENLWEEYIGARYYHVIQNERVAFPMAHSDVDFKHPLQFGDRPLVKVTCFKLGRSSLGLRYIFEVNGKVCVDARTTTVCINADSFKSIEIPAAYRSYFQRIMAPLDNDQDSPSSP